MSDKIENVVHPQKFGFSTEVSRGVPSFLTTSHPTIVKLTVSCIWETHSMEKLCYRLCSSCSSCQSCASPTSTPPSLAQLSSSFRRQDDKWLRPKIQYAKVPQRCNEKGTTPSLLDALLQTFYRGWLSFEPNRSIGNVAQEVGPLHVALTQFKAAGSVFQDPRWLDRPDRSTPGDRPSDPQKAKVAPWNGYIAHLQTPA